jgi:hypothetical protein
MLRKPENSCADADTQVLDVGAGIYDLSLDGNGGIGVQTSYHEITDGPAQGGRFRAHHAVECRYIATRKTIDRLDVEYKCSIQERFNSARDGQTMKFGAAFVTNVLVAMRRVSDWDRYGQESAVVSNI